MDEQSLNIMAAQNLARRIPRFAVYLVALLVVLITVGYVGLLGLRTVYASGFAVPPKVFNAQADALKVGMTKAEVMAKVTIFTKCSDDDSKITFSLHPNSDGFFLRVRQHIVVYFDGEPQRVVKFFCNDG